MPELERGAGYETLISRVARDPALVAAAVLIATGHILAVRNTAMSRSIARCIFGLKSFVLNTVNEALRDPERATSDPLICAILILAGHEGLQGKPLSPERFQNTGCALLKSRSQGRALAGSSENFHIHMRGLVQMINLRGGLSRLNETQKYLEAFVIWQDTNVSAILRCEPYWKLAENHTKELPSVTPNPAMWLLKDV